MNALKNIGNMFVFPAPSSSRRRRPHSAGHLRHVEHVHTRRPSRSRSQDSPPPEYSLFSEPSLRDTLRETARQTQAVLHALFRELGTTAEAQAYFSTKHTLDNPLRLDSALCPRFREQIRIRVINEDTLNAGIDAAARASQDDATHHNPYPAIVNFADRNRPGGGWLNGAMAQEESLCYRSSLSLSLDGKRGHYPLSAREAEVIYSPFVVVVRGDLASGHQLLLDSHGGGAMAHNLPVVSALTVNAIRRPDVRQISPLSGSAVAHDKYVFQRDRDRTLTKDKMRLVLRVAAWHRHRHLVLGAMGCGVYANPPEDVAHCWLEVLREDEFRGNWWRSVCFAIYDPKKEGNYEIFSRVLHDQKV